MKRIALLLVLSACGKSEKLPSCAEVTDHVLEVSKNMYPGHGDMGGAGNRTQQIEACEARKITARERRCILAAKSLDAIGQCRRETLKNDSGQREGGPAAPK